MQLSIYNCEYIRLFWKDTHSIACTYTATENYFCWRNKIGKFGTLTSYNKINAELLLFTIRTGYFLMISSHTVNVLQPLYRKPLRMLQNQQFCTGISAIIAYHNTGVGKVFSSVDRNFQRKRL